MRRRGSIDDPMNFMESFVDLLSCGLGAALLLFLIFATMPRSGADRVGRAQSALVADDRSSAGMPTRTGVHHLVVEIDAPEGLALNDVKMDGVKRLDLCDISHGVRAGRRLFLFNCIATDSALAGSCVEVSLAKVGRVGLTVSKLTSVGRAGERLIIGDDAKQGIASIWVEQPSAFLVADRSCR